MIDLLATLTRDVEVTIGGDTFTSEERLGHVVRAIPGKILAGTDWVANTENVGKFIRLHLRAGTYLWVATLDDYDPVTNLHDPVADPRWEVE